MTIRGTVPLKFGSTAVTGYIVMDDASKENMADTVTIEDHDGNIVTDISGITPRGTVKATFVPKVATVPPEPGEAMEIGIDGGAVTFVVDKINTTNKPKTPSTWTMEGHFNPATEP